MNEPIKVGDLVVIVRWPCCGHSLGHVYGVADFVDWTARRAQYVFCRACSAQLPFAMFATSIAGGGENAIAAPPQWLKRIPPLSELESTTTEDKVTA